jgi:hypothetical protein
VALFLATAVAAEETRPVPPPPPPTVAAARGGPAEDIKVHGHWTITVRNGDGSITSQMEFDNRLVEARGQFLAGLLDRSAALLPTPKRISA